MITPVYDDMCVSIYSSKANYIYAHNCAHWCKER